MFIIGDQIGFSAEEVWTLHNTHNTETGWHKLTLVLLQEKTLTGVEGIKNISVGPISLLASQCITIIHHYLDLMSKWNICSYLLFTRAAPTARATPAAAATPPEKTARPIAPCKIKMEDHQLSTKASHLLLTSFFRTCSMRAFRSSAGLLFGSIARSCRQVSSTDGWSSIIGNRPA